MLRFLRKQPNHREALLAAIPVRNEQVREKPIDSGLRLTAPLRPSTLRRIFVPRDAAIPEKSFELDDLGAWVWRALDGRRNVEQLIRAFADHHRLNLREAEVAVLAFLKTLAQRNLIGLVAPQRP
jgi:hypothetical protein